MAKVELILDLDDGLGPVQATVGPKEREARGHGVASFKAPPSVPLTRVPVAIVQSYANVHCAACGGQTREYRGLFLDEHLSNGVRVLSRRTMRELLPFFALPRRVDAAPPEVIDFCPECFASDHAWRDAMAREQAQAELPWATEDLVEHTKAKVAAAATLAIDLEDLEL